CPGCRDFCRKRKTLFLSASAECHLEIHQLQNHSVLGAEALARLLLHRGVLCGRWQQAEFPSLPPLLGDGVRPVRLPDRAGRLLHRRGPVGAAAGGDLRPRRVPLHQRAPRFCPYKDTEIGRPNFKLEVSDDKKKTTLYVADPATALYKDGRQLNIRDVFSDQLQYRVTYRKNKSTGKKVYNYKTNIIELLDLDRGVSYCFNVQAYLPDRAADKQLGELSHTQCTKDHNQSIFEVYSVGVIASAIFLILLLIGIIIAVTYICCKRHKNSQGREKEGMPLRDV
uniref:Tissue factor n=1 Tax=Scophthalmus maximus TaxID=52904 RepID=A0A8D3DR15_SCOMX